jgi:histidinol phosphatase-like PHP family hydrolase
VIDLHVHSLFSDGELLPSEIARRCEVNKLKVIAITDHADSSNLDFVIPRVVNVCKDINREWKITVVPGIELTHVPPHLLRKLSAKARELGAKILLVHGETLIESVAPGTNLEALKCDIDILAHPGLLTVEEAKLAKSNDIALELTTRHGHSLANGHVAKVAMSVGAKLVLNTDAHKVEELLDFSLATKVVRGAGLDAGELRVLLGNSQRILNKRVGGDARAT